MLLKSLLGHSEILDTDGTYGHEINGDLRRAAKLVDVVFTREETNRVEKWVASKKEKP